jgi:hypothetical protein
MHIATVPMVGKGRFRRALSPVAPGRPPANQRWTIRGLDRPPGSTAVLQGCCQGCCQGGPPPLPVRPQGLRGKPCLLIHEFGVIVAVTIIQSAATVIRFR